MYYVVKPENIETVRSSYWYINSCVRDCCTAEIIQFPVLVKYQTTLWILMGKNRPPEPQGVWGRGSGFQGSESAHANQPAQLGWNLPAVFYVCMYTAQLLHIIAKDIWVFDNSVAEFWSQPSFTCIFMPANVHGTILGNLKGYEKYKGLFLHSGNYK